MVKSKVLSAVQTSPGTTHDVAMRAFGRADKASINITAAYLSRYVRAGVIDVGRHVIREDAMGRPMKCRIYRVKA